MRSVLLLFGFLTSITVSGQTLVSWSTFAEVTFYREYSETFGFDVNVKPPKFSERLLALNGQEIRVKG